MGTTVYILWILATTIPARLTEPGIAGPVFEVPEWQTYVISVADERTNQTYCAALAAEYMQQGFQAFCQKHHF